MPRSLLPPRGIEIPTVMLYHHDISPAVRDTWAQLRGLAWGQNETPELPVSKLSEMLNKSQSTIYEHMRLLRTLGSLSWLTTEKKGIIVRFPETDFINLLLSEKLESETSQQSEISEMPPLDQSLDLINENRRSKEIPNFRKVGIENRRKPDTVPAEILRPIIDALADVTSIDKKLNYSRLAKEAKALHLAGYTASQVIQIYGEGGKWYTVDWRGQKGELPGLGLVRSTIKALLECNRNRRAPRAPSQAANPHGAMTLEQRAKITGENLDDLKKAQVEF